jgi:ferrous iron transport protein B
LRRPLAGNVLVKTVARIQWYLREALPLFLLGTLLVWALDRTGALHAIERACAPAVVGLLGLPEEAAGALLLGFLRRDYAAAGLFARWLPAMRAGALSPLDEVQIVTALVVVTLFVPCIANVFVIVKERGAKTAAAMLAFIFPTAFAAGALVNLAMRRLWL